jgi:DNA-binding MarR family transcriptional regulator
MQMKKGKPIVEEVPVLLGVYDLMSHVSQLWREHTGNDSITLPQYLFLSAVAANPMQSQIFIGRYVSMDRSTVSTITKTLIDKSWLIAHVDQADRRLRKLELTPLGLKTVKNMTVVVSSIEEMLHARRSDGYKTAIQWLVGVRDARIKIEKAAVQAERADL